ncbi:acyl-CoA dehydrogenase family protein [Bradyrhizobium sp. CCGUVB1N3]|uniref:acyl-CoA dehydrogenase family protein n=1 Tax=Bradyrhizobium sp. CCGUVB1N3 TaxID=2949629 RepID=UPI0020B31B4D|nr:acyl-CoA dehydrogenase family protein [Bradyrhizobium sp. CCGUVB1N3]MCP3476674.1 acyl-CoA dehydrogenase family protein [Bradyrhizobium sp. CCGUVB1N3]
MSANAAGDARAAETRTAVDVARELGPILAQRANETTDEDRFIADNFTLLRSAGLVEAGVPAELGGGGASIDELAEMLRTLGYHCGSTALALSMHTHPVATAAWRWKHQKVTTVEALLKRIATEHILLVTSGGSDWIAGSGKAERVDGGYRITGRKAFASCVPVGDLFMTSAILENEGEPPTVLHFGIPLNSPQVRVLDTWRALGMRGTGSHDLVIEGHIVPDSAIAARRKAGEWDPLFEVIATISMPLIYSVYLGVAESARDIALSLAKQKQVTRYVLERAGRMDTELAAARLAHESMLGAVRLNAPSADTVNRVMIGKQLVTRHAIGAVDFAMELAGGVGFYRLAGLERRFRDIQAARYHPLKSEPQMEYAGAIALGLPVDRIF